MLGGAPSASLGDITEALGSINDYFDECAESCIFVLPVTQSLQVINLGVNQTASFSELIWVTNSNDKNESFVIEHSENGTDFTPLQELVSKRNGLSVENYKSVDTAPIQGINFYRIKEVLMDGSIHYSNIQGVNYSGDLNSIRVFPNPASSHVFISLAPYQGLSGTIQVISAQGVSLFQQSFEEIPNENYQIDVSQYREGIYLMSIQAEGKHSITKRFMVTSVR